MQWHFSPETGSPFWLERARALDFDPLTDVRTFDDLALLPNVVDELRDVPVRELIPRGYGNEHAARVYESGGTTGQPKRVVSTAEWERLSAEWFSERLDNLSVARDVDWLSAIPSGPHGVAVLVTMTSTLRGGLNHALDLDPRWVKKLVEQGRTAESDSYIAHVIEQMHLVLQSQDVGVLMSTPPLLERLAQHDDLVELINRKVRTIIWGGAHMDADTRDLLRSEVFPEARLVGVYGSTTVLGSAVERADGDEPAPCVFDTFSPYITFRVVNPETGKPVPYGERGQVVMNHVTKSALLVNNPERDYATRIAPPPGGLGDSVADVSPATSFGGAAVIEGVY
ncbi:AMP-binding protein [Streptomyces sp. NPDC057199]|uniref:AMP-binding protein n=1 Tax=Streptomyces sp. NPDC057199 TaxID=3346047 RepID=UPI0036268B6E